MHLLEIYASTCGCLIDKCFIHEETIDLPPKQYITFHGFNPKGSCRQYKHWQVIIDWLKNNNFDYEIIQIGGINDIKYNNINTSYLGKTNYNQLAFLIKHASLHIGYDSLPIHLASMYDKKIIGVYAHWSSVTGPYFSSSENTILFQPDNSIVKPFYGETDPNDKINTIDPLDIYNAINKLLGIK
mgnify:CR=1 FL=1